MLEQDAPAAKLIGDAARNHGERLIDHLYKRVLEAFGFLFVGVLVIVMISRVFVSTRLACPVERDKRDASTRSAGVMHTRVYISPDARGPR